MGIMLMSIFKVEPYFRWAGGKRRLVPTLHQLLPTEYTQYVEPFLGSACMYLSLTTNKPILSDINLDLITSYKVIKTDVDKLITVLQELAKDTSSDGYYTVRDMDRSSSWHDVDDITRAARFIYLNRTCFNGLYRVNSKGQNNTPYGKISNPRICIPDHLHQLSDYFNDTDAEFIHTSYDSYLDRIQPKALVYLDPPYHPLSDTSSFVAYSCNGWSNNDEVRLKEYCDKLTNRGIYFMLSNSDTDYIKDLFAEYTIHEVSVMRSIAANRTKRNMCTEVVITNY